MNTKDYINAMIDELNERDAGRYVWHVNSVYTAAHRRKVGATIDAGGIVGTPNDVITFLQNRLQDTRTA